MLAVLKTSLIGMFESEVKLQVSQRPLLDVEGEKTPARKRLSQPAAVLVLTSTFLEVEFLLA